MLRVLAWLGAGLAILLVGVPLLVLGFANTGLGRGAIERAASHFTNGMVVVAGLHGRFPDELRLDHLEVRDGQGAWLSADDIALDWSPLALLSRTAHVERLTAAQIAVPRLPAAGPATAPTPANDAPWYDYRLPVRVAVDALDAPRITLGKPVAGVAAILSAKGHADLAALQNGAVSLAIDRVDAPGHYQLDGKIDAASIAVALAAREPAHGFAASAGGLPDLGALALDASLTGPRDAEALALALDAGPLDAGPLDAGPLDAGPLDAGSMRARATGTIDLPGQSARLAVTAHAPAMTPAPGVSWRSLALDANVSGPFSKPDADGTIAIVGLLAGGASIGHIDGTLAGNQGAASVRGQLDGVRLPGPRPDLLGADPVAFEASARLDDPARPVRFSVTHKLLSLTGTAMTGGDLSATAHLDLPAIAPFAAIAGVAADGQAHFALAAARRGEATDASLDGTFGLHAGPAPAPALIGESAHLAAKVSLDGSDVTLQQLTLDGANLKVEAKGADTAGTVAFDWHVILPALKVAAPTLAGRLDARGSVSGKTDDLTADATIGGDIGAPGIKPGPVTLAAHATGLPTRPDASISAHGTVDGAPLSVEAQAVRAADGTLDATLKALAWKSAKASGEAHLAPGDALPALRLQASMTRLGDLSPFIGQALRGSVTAKIDTAKMSGVDRATIDVRAEGAGAASASVGHLTLGGTIDDPTGAPRFDLRLDAKGIDAGSIAGDAALTATGPQNALGLRLSTTLHGAAVGEARATAAATLDLPGKLLSVASLDATAKGETARLLAPMRVKFADGLSIDRLRLGIQQAVLDLSGRVLPTLDLTASLRDVTPALAKPFAPTLDADGRVSLDARLRGNPAAPEGTVRVNASGLRMRSGPAASLPPAAVDADATLTGGAAKLHARINAGPRLSLALAGSAPLAARGALDLHAQGTIDLALVDPITEAQGRRVAGQASLDLAASGTIAAPRLSGTVTLARGEVQDFAQGARLSGITARLHGDGQSLTIDQLVAHAGAGTISATGRVGLAEPGLPVDLTITARHASPLSSDQLTAVIDGDVMVRGLAASRLDASGTITVERANITIPDSLPPSVVVLKVRRPGDKPAPASGASLLIGLALTVDAPEQIFVRGHGLDAEMGGRLTIGGTSVAPLIGGGFALRRGTFSLAGANLTFVRGRVAFDGAGLSNRIDPTLDFEADTSSGSVIAKLLIGGYASKPKITLASDPTLPQDEIIAHLLFGVSVKQLSAFQLAEIGVALASLTGVTSSDPLGNIQKRLGLDRLSVGGGSGANNTGATIEAGRYVAKGVFVGAKQGTNGGTQAEVQVDLTRHLKLQTTLGTGGGSAQGATPQNDPGSSVGLSYQFEY